MSLSDVCLVNSEYELLVTPVMHLLLPFLLALMIFWPVARTLVSENLYCIQ